MSKIDNPELLPIARQESTPVRHILSRQFLSAGRAIFTVAPSPAFLEANPMCKPWYSYKIGRPSEDAPMFASLLTGPDNEHSFIYLGVCCASSGELRMTKASKLESDSFPCKILNRVLLRLFAGEQEKIEIQGWRLFHSGRCGRCNRLLTTPESVERGLGSECDRIMKGGK